MFKAIATIFRAITETAEMLNVLARTGHKYTLQFEAEADIALAKKKALLAEQEVLTKA